MARSRRPTEAVIDTSCLLNLLVLHYVKTVRVQDPRRNDLLCKASNSLFINRNNSVEDGYYAFFSRYRRLHTTSHVIAELSRHVNDLFRKHDSGRFWIVAIEYLRSKQFDEHLITLLDLDSSSSFASLLPKIGPPDVGLMQLALTLGVELLTEDRRTLVSRADETIINCVVVREKIRGII